jgi:WD40 repeat protein
VARGSGAGVGGVGVGVGGVGVGAGAGGKDEKGGTDQEIGELRGERGGLCELKDFLDPTPFRVLEGHTGDIMSLSWSKSNFLLSASTDKTVSLWHVSRDERLQFFRHPDIVTAVEFHPAHDRYYISGCFDRKLRVWDIIPDGIVQEWTQTTDTVSIWYAHARMYYTYIHIH